MARGKGRGRLARVPDAARLGPPKPGPLLGVTPRPPRPPTQGTAARARVGGACEGEGRRAVRGPAARGQGGDGGKRVMLRARWLPFFWRILLLLLLRRRRRRRRRRLAGSGEGSA